MKKNVLFFLCFFILLGSSVFAQEENDTGSDKEKKKEEEKNKFTENLFFGGSIDLLFDNFTTRVGISPEVGYHLTPRFDIGIGGKYLYYNTNSGSLGNIRPDNSVENFSFSAHIFGGSLFGRAVLIKNLNDILPFTFHGRLSSHLEYEALNIPSDFDPENNSSRFWSQYYWIGGGLQQKIGEKAYFNIFVLYNLNEKSTYQLYDNPTVRIGIIF